MLTRLSKIRILEMDNSRRPIIMEQDTNRYQSVGDFLAQENRANAKRKYVEVHKRNRDNTMIYICDRGNRPQDQREWQPRWPDGSHILPQREPAVGPFYVEYRAIWQASSLEWWYSFLIRVEKLGTRRPVQRIGIKPTSPFEGLALRSHP